MSTTSTSLYAVAAFVVLFSGCHSPEPTGERQAEDTDTQTGTRDEHADERSPKLIDEPVKISLVPIPAGRLRMKSADGEEGLTSVKMFELGVYEVTQAEYERVMDLAPSQFKGGDRRPVESVSWSDAIDFCNRLSNLEGLPPYYNDQREIVGGCGYRLPTDVEWEYACRAGSESLFCFGDKDGDLKNYAWFDRNSGDSTHPVGKKNPNAWGLHDMHGNVREWCWDWCDPDSGGVYSEHSPNGPSQDSLRVSRGGGWRDDSTLCRSETRLLPRSEKPYSTNDYLQEMYADAPVAADDLGFRVARSPDERIPQAVANEFVSIPAGSFWMGASDSDIEWLAANTKMFGFQRSKVATEEQRREVSVTEFQLSAFEVNQAEYERVMGGNPSRFTGDGRRPVEQVSWLNAIRFCNRLSELEGRPPYYDSQGDILGGEGYRLPTEEEWEYACRAGSDGPFCFGGNLDELRQYSWFDRNSNSSTHPVGRKRPNAWGLYDMHGNVNEWCWDLVKQLPYRSERGEFRVFRGGSWHGYAEFCRSAARNADTPAGSAAVGFRVALDATHQD